MADKESLVIGSKVKAYIKANGFKCSGELIQSLSDTVHSALDHAIGKVDQAQKAAGDQVSAFIAGDQENLHEVVIAMNQAEIYLQMMTEVRNRMLETYQELMRMQV